MAKLKLRPYQEQAVEAGLGAMAKGKPAILQLATGLGKSVIIAELCDRLNSNILVLCPSKEILEQNKAKVESYGYDCGVYSASVGIKQIKPITLATPRSITSGLERGTLTKEELAFGAIIVDECHTVAPKASGTIISIVDQLGVSKVLGLTATPFRQVIKSQRWIKRRDGSKFPLSEVVTRALTRIPAKGRESIWFWSGGIVFKYGMGRAIKDGWLSNVNWRVSVPADWKDLLRKTKEAGDFQAEELEKWWRKNGIGELTVRTILQAVKECDKVLVFVPSVELSKALQLALIVEGVSTIHIDGTVPTKEREKRLKKFREGKAKVLTNVGVLTTGFDLPYLDGLVLARPTMSMSLLIQMYGRLVRLSDKEKKFYDVSGTTAQIGRPENITLGKRGHLDVVVTWNGKEWVDLGEASIKNLIDKGKL